MEETLSPKLKQMLLALAQKYETADFLSDDPSQFLRRYKNPVEQEMAAFITAQLSFGRRDQFIPRLEKMFLHADSFGGMSEWLLGGHYKKFFPKSSKKFYRFFSFKDMEALCGRLAQILLNEGSIGKAVSKNCGAAGKDELFLVSALISVFPGIKCVSQNPKSACKKLHMFLRWMVRKNSPVDLGLWDFATPKDLLIPLDVHVMKESQALGLIPPKSTASAKTAILLTKKMAQVWPDDPCKGDFALFGLGVDSVR